MSGEGSANPSSVSPGRPGSSVYPTNPLGEKFDGIAYRKRRRMGAASRLPSA